MLAEKGMQKNWFIGFKAYSKKGGIWAVAYAAHIYGRRKGPHMRMIHICIHISQTCFTIFICVFGIYAGCDRFFLQSAFMRKKCWFNKICVHFYLKNAYMRASKFSDILGNSNYFLGKLIFFFHDHPLA